MTCNEESRHKLAFYWRGKYFVFTRAPIGLKFISAQFQRLMHVVFKDLPFVLAYVDDIWIVSENDSDVHLKHITLAIQRLFRLNADKCQFFLRAFEGLGHRITPYGIQVDPEKVASIRAIPLPASYQNLSNFLGILNYSVSPLKDVPIHMGHTTRNQTTTADQYQTDADRTHGHLHEHYKPNKGNGGHIGVHGAIGPYQSGTRRRAFWNKKCHGTTTL